MKNIGYIESFSNHWDYRLLKSKTDLYEGSYEIILVEVCYELGHPVSYHTPYPIVIEDLDLDPEYYSTESIKDAYKLREFNRQTLIHLALDQPILSEEDFPEQ